MNGVDYCSTAMCVLQGVYYTSLSLSTQLNTTADAVEYYCRLMSGIVMLIAKEPRCLLSCAGVSLKLAASCTILYACLHCICIEPQRCSSPRVMILFARCPISDRIVLICSRFFLSWGYGRFNVAAAITVVPAVPGLFVTATFCSAWLLPFIPYVVSTVCDRGNHERVLKHSSGDV